MYSVEVPNMGQFLSYMVCEPLLYERVTFCVIFITPSKFLVTAQSTTI